MALNPNQPNPPDAWDIRGPMPGGPSAAAFMSSGPGQLLAAVDQSGYQYEQAATGLTAHSGGGQANGWLLSTGVNIFSTVAVAADSALLPPTLAATGSKVSQNIAQGLAVFIVVFNRGGNSMNVFPATGEQINALGANNAFAIPPNKSATFVSGESGQWVTQLSA